MCELPKYPNKDILIGFDSSDDACVYRVSDDVAIVQTVDFFPPMVDDPYLFGQIAAANAISDVYAMGGKPIFALNLLCFPNCLDLEVAGEILAGGADKAAEAMCTIAGGHSITDDEPKYGMCVTGTVHPQKVLANNSPRRGDAVVITKALGTGILTTAFKGEFIGEDDLKPATDAMRQLNRYAAEAAEGLRVHACTDITGFGFAGHLCEMMEGSGMTAQISAQKLPILPRAMEMASYGMVPGGAYRNRDHFDTKLDLSGVSQSYGDVMLDPQTSGGLMFSVDEKDVETLLRRLRDAGVIGAQVGWISAYDGVLVRAKEQ